MARSESWVRDSLPLSGRSPRTVEGYAASVRLHVVPGLGRVPLTELTPAHVQGFLRKELELGKGPRTVQLAHAALRIALGQAESWGLVQRNVAKLVQAPGAKTTERRPFSADERARILHAARSEPLYPLFLTAAATGLRLSELLGLRWQDLELDDAQLRVRHQLGSKTRKLEPLKTAASRRTVPLPPAEVSTLRAHRQNQKRKRLAARVWEDSGLVFCTSVGTPLSQRNVTRVWDRVVARSGV